MGRWWLYDMWEGDRVFAVSWIVWVVVSIVLHELSHGWAAIRQGDRTPIELGHMTWNPMVHMPPMSWLLFALSGLAYGLMPVSPSRFRSRHGDALVSFAGPSMNLSISVVCAVLCVLWIGHAPRFAAEPLLTNVRKFLFIGCGLNMALAIFNLIPVPPLDGSSILASFVPQVRQFYSGQTGVIVMIVGFALLYGVLGPQISLFSAEMSAWLIDTVRQVLGPIAGGRSTP